MVMVMVMVYGLWFMAEQLKLIFGGMMSRGLSPWGAGGTHFDTNMANIPMYPAIIPIFALLSDTLGVLRI